MFKLGLVEDMPYPHTEILLTLIKPYALSSKLQIAIIQGEFLIPANSVMTELVRLGLSGELWASVWATRPSSNPDTSAVDVSRWPDDDHRSSIALGCSETLQTAGRAAVWSQITQPRGGITSEPCRQSARGIDFIFSSDKQQIAVPERLRQRARGRIRKSDLILCTGGLIRAKREKNLCECCYLDVPRHISVNSSIAGSENQECSMSTGWTHQADLCNRADAERGPDSHTKDSPCIYTQPYALLARLREAAEGPGKCMGTQLAMFSVGFDLEMPTCAMPI